MRKYLLLLTTLSLTNVAIASSLFAVPNYSFIESYMGISFNLNDYKDSINTIKKFLHLNLVNKIKISQDFNFTYGFECDIDNLYSENNNYELYLDFTFNNNTISLGRYDDNVKTIIDSTDIFNYSNYDKYNFKHNNSGLITYEFNYENLKTAFAYGTPKVIDEKNHSTYNRNAQQQDRIQDTFSSSFGYTFPINNKLNFRFGYSYALNPNLTTTNYESNVRAYLHHAYALTYDNKNNDLFFALMFNERNYDLYKQTTSEREYSVRGAEFALKKRIDDYLGLKLGYEYIELDVDSFDTVNTINIPIEISFNMNKNVEIWGQARFNITNKTNFNHAVFDDWNDNFKFFDDNSYSAGILYRF